MKDKDRKEKKKSHHIVMVQNTHSKVISGGKKKNRAFQPVNKKCPLTGDNYIQEGN